MTKLFDLTGKTALITGGNGGIGYGIAQGLAEAGANIAVAARNQEKTEKACAALEKDFGVKTIGITVDVRDEQSINTMVDKCVEKFGSVDILVNNAGTNIRKFPQDLEADEWDLVLDVNLRSAFLASKAVYPHMKKAGGGKIINTGSMTSILGGIKHSAYGASKGGIKQLAMSLAVSWAPDNIQVNSILPGWIDTELTIRARKDIEGLNEEVIAKTPAGRWGVPEDLAGLAVFLASKASDFVTGAFIPVDGGLSIAL